MESFETNMIIRKILILSEGTNSKREGVFLELEPGTGIHEFSHCFLPRDLIALHLVCVTSE